MSEITIREIASADIPALVRINDEASPAVPVTPLPEFAELVALSTIALVAERSSDFHYIDRIVLAPEARGAGLGSELYGRIFAAATQRGASEVTCEVNVEPPNPASLAFHAALGFAEVARQSTKGGSVVVALLAAPA